MQWYSQMWSKQWIPPLKVVLQGGKASDMPRPRRQCKALSNNALWLLVVVPVVVWAADFIPWFTMLFICLGTSLTIITWTGVSVGWFVHHFSIGTCWNIWNCKSPSPKLHQCSLCSLHLMISGLVFSLCTCFALNGLFLFCQPSYKMLPHAKRPVQLFQSSLERVIDDAYTWIWYQKRSLQGRFLLESRCLWDNMCSFICDVFCSSWTKCWKRRTSSLAVSRSTVSLAVFTTLWRHDPFC